MKKLTIAIASISALAASATFAETVYEGDDLTLEIKGEVDSQIRKTTIEDSNFDHRFDDVDFAVKASYESESGITAFSYFKADFAKLADQEDGDDDDNILSQAYVGIETSGVTITYGINDYATDNFGIGQDVEFGSTTAILSTGGNEVIRADYDMDGLFLSASYDLPETKTVGTEEVDDESSFDVYGEYAVADGITVAGFFQTQKVDGDADSYMAVGASVEYSQNGLTAGAAVAYTDAETWESDFSDDPVAIDGATSIEVAGAYDVSEDLTLGGGFGMQLLDIDIDDPMQVYGNVQYAVAPMSTVYAELHYDIIDDDAAETELGYAVGMKVKF